jgi:hypothetical protein
MIYLVDRQALAEKLVTMMSLDCDGGCVWWYHIELDGLWSLGGWF